MNESSIITLFDTESFLLKLKMNIAANVIIPIPPNWISRRIIICPVIVKVDAVSTDVSPVTQTADVAVNSALIHEIPEYVETGILRKRVPVRISTIKDSIR